GRPAKTWSTRTGSKSCCSDGPALAGLKTEKQQEVDAGALDPPERRAGDQRLRIRERGAQPQDARERVLERGFVVRIRPELPAEARHQTREDFLTDRYFRPAAEFSKRLDLEDFQSELVLDRAQERRRDETGR